MIDYKLIIRGMFGNARSNHIRHGVVLLRDFERCGIGDLRILLDIKSTWRN